MKKFITVAEMRDLDQQLALGKISYSRMMKILNEKAEKWYNENIENKQCMSCEKSVQYSTGVFTCSECYGFDAEDF
jgi:protein-arginine kinase activator protein McsA